MNKINLSTKIPRWFYYTLLVLTLVTTGLILTVIYAPISYDSFLWVLLILFLVLWLTFIVAIFISRQYLVISPTSIKIRGLLLTRKKASKSKIIQIWLISINTENLTTFDPKLPSSFIIVNRTPSFDIDNLQQSLFPIHKTRDIRLLNNCEEIKDILTKEGYSYASKELIIPSQDVYNELVNARLAAMGKSDRLK